MSTNEIVRRTIRLCMVELKSRITSIPLVVTYLFSRMVIDDETYDKARMKDKTEPERLEEVLLFLLKKDIHEFEIFLKVLLETDNKYSHDRLKEEYETQLSQMTQAALSLGSNGQNRSQPQSSSVPSYSSVTQPRGNPSPVVVAHVPPRTSASTAVTTVPTTASQTTNASQGQGPANLNITNTAFEIRSDPVEPKLAQLQANFPNRVVPAASILESLKTAKSLKNIWFTAVTVSGEFSSSVVLPKLESVIFTHCKLQPKTQKWKDIIFFSKRQQQASSTAAVENVWTMGVQIHINCGGIYLLKADQNDGALIINAKTGIDLKPILESLGNANVKPLKTLEAVGFKPTDFVSARYPHLRELRLLDVEIGVFKDMGLFREILQTIGDLRSLQVSIGTNNYSPDKQVVIFLSKIKSARTLVTLKITNLDVKHSEGKIESNGPVFPLVTSCEFNKCSLNGPLRDRFWTDFPLVNRSTHSKVVMRCTDEAGNSISLA